MVRAWGISSYIVTSGSMAPAFVGPHRHVVCPECRFAFDCDADPAVDALSGPSQAFCPNCCAICPNIEQLPILAGDRVVALRGAFALRTPRRWEPVIVSHVGGTDAAVTKRVVGLPGEEIELRQGNVWIDGKLVRKTLAEQRAMAIPVHDNRFGRGESSSHAAAWRTDRLGDLAAASPSPADLPDEGLVYHHFWLRPGSLTEMTETPIEDRYAFNQSQPVFENFVVPELLLGFRLTAATQGALWIFASDGENRFMVAIDCEIGAATLSRNGEQLQSVDRAMAFPLYADFAHRPAIADRLRGQTDFRALSLGGGATSNT